MNHNNEHVKSVGMLILVASVAFYVFTPNPDSEISDYKYEQLNYMSTDIDTFQNVNDEIKRALTDRKVTNGEYIYIKSLYKNELNKDSVNNANKLIDSIGSN